MEGGGEQNSKILSQPISAKLLKEIFQNHFFGQKEKLRKILPVHGRTRNISKSKISKAFEMLPSFIMEFLKFQNLPPA